MSIAIIYEQIADKVKEFIASLEIDTLYEIVRERTPFAEGKDYILLSKMSSHNITIGAALPYIKNFWITCRMLSLNV